IVVKASLRRRLGDA
ncbi:hypothetical protein Zm00014a_019566, partial [Zea mays]